MVRLWAANQEGMMAQLFARVELRGDPGEDVYQRLHAYMESMHWYRNITGTREVTLPHATYQATTNTDAPGIAKMADTIKSGIESQIWTKAIVLMIQSTTWAQTAG
jgi:hypothetical protein